MRLLVARAESGLEHAHFTQLPELLDPGDLLVINTSATLPASVAVRGPEAGVSLNLSGPVPGDDPHLWVAELRRAGERYRGGREGQVLLLPAGGTAVLLERDRGRLWRVSLRVPGSLRATGPHASPFVIATRPRLAAQKLSPFTRPSGQRQMQRRAGVHSRARDSAVARGVDPRSARCCIPSVSLEIGGSRARALGFPASRPRGSTSRANWGRVIAVGTTVVRALEAAAGADGRVPAKHGWADLVIARHRIRALNGLLSGFHDRDSTHLAMLEAIAGRELLERSYDEALRAGYLRHEFGDLHLLLP